MMLTMLAVRGGPLECSNRCNVGPCDRSYHDDVSGLGYKDDVDDVDGQGGSFERSNRGNGGPCDRGYKDNTD